MSLVVQCIEEFSGRPIGYFRERQKELVLTLLRRCLSNRSIGTYRSRVQRIYQHIREHNESGKLWRDCEIYYPLDYLQIPKEKESYPYLITLLELFAGLKDIRDVAGLPDGYYRLQKQAGGVFYQCGDGMEEIPRKKIIFRLSDWASDCYLPRNGLFSDLFDETFYPPMESPYDPADMKRKLMRSIGHLKSYSKELWEDFQNATYTLVLLTNSPKEGVHSVNACFRYFGSVFVNLFKNDEVSAGESLIHEYTHNRCWLWWEYKKPSGVPGDDVYIESPVTGSKVRASTMIHAFIIYVNALQFYRFVQSAKSPADQTVLKRLNQRASHISRSMPSLYRRLARKVKRGTDMSRLLDFLMEKYGRV